MGVRAQKTHTELVALIDSRRDAQLRHAIATTLPNVYGAKFQSQHRTLQALAPSVAAHWAETLAAGGDRDARYQAALRSTFRLAFADQHADGFDDRFAAYDAFMVARYEQLLALSVPANDVLLAVPTAWIDSPAILPIRSSTRLYEVALPHPGTTRTTRGRIGADAVLVEVPLGAAWAYCEHLGAEIREPLHHNPALEMALGLTGNKLRDMDIVDALQAATALCA